MEQEQATEINLMDAQSGEAKTRATDGEMADVKLISIAMTMAIVSMLFAVAVYRAALAEQETLRLEGRLQQGEMLELVHRQDLLSLASSRARYEVSANTHQALADSSEKEEQKLAAVDRRQAAAKKLQAEEELAHVRSLVPYLNFFDLEAPIAEETAEWLRNLGFDTSRAIPAAKDSLPDMWQKLSGDVSQGQERVTRLAQAIVLFVFALALLTFAQLNYTTPKRAKVLAWIGGALSSLGLVVSMWADRASWNDFLWVTAAVGIMALIGAPLAGRFNGAARVGGEEPTASLAPGFVRLAISTVFLSAILCVITGYSYNHAALASSSAIHAAQKTETDFFRTNAQDVTVWNVMGRMATAEDYQLRYEAARQSWQLAMEEPALLNKTDATDQLNRRRAALESFEQKEPEAHKLMTGDLGPEQDVHFPLKMVASFSYYKPALVAARLSINNEMGMGYQREAAASLTLLIFVPIALYLLGQALSMGRSGVAFILGLFACSLVAVGVLRGLFVELGTKPIELRAARAECRMPGLIADDNLIELAAEHFANGLALYQGSSDDPEASKQAAKEFGCAAEIHPTFTLARLYFARATNRANTPHLNEGAFVSMISKDSLGTVSQAESQAIDLLKQQGFAPPSDLVGDYGFDTYANGLVKGDPKAVELGRRGSVEAIKLLPYGPMVHFNRGLAEMAERREQESLETYRQALTMSEPGKMPFVTNDAAMIGGAITDLEVFRQYCGGLNNATYCNQFATTDLPKLKSEMVAAAWPAAKGRTMAGSGIKLTDLTLWGSSVGLGWSGNVENLPQDPAAKTQDSLVILWYAHDNEWDAWRVLPVISERVNPAFYAQGYAKLFYSTLRASDGRICLQSGDYRAEFYVDGELAGTKDITLEHERVKPGVFPDLDISLCYPSLWKPWKPQDADVVWTRGYIEDGKNRGVFVFSFFDPQQDGLQASKEHGLKRAETILQKEGLTAGPVEPTQLYECAGLQGPARDLMTAFKNGGSTSLAKAWTTKEGFVNVVVVVDKNPPGSGSDKPTSAQNPARQDCEILLSATTVEP